MQYENYLFQKKIFNWMIRFSSVHFILSEFIDRYDFFISFIWKIALARSIILWIVFIKLDLKRVSLHRNTSVRWFSFYFLVKAQFRLLRFWMSASFIVAFVRMLLHAHCSHCIDLVALPLSIWIRCHDKSIDWLP